MLPHPPSCQAAGAARRGRLALTVALLCAPLAPHAASPELPVPAGLWVKSGAATRQTVGNTMTIRQRSAHATLQWDSFNIGPDKRVRFEQPDASAVALNLIGQDDPARIFGTLEANGQVYLVNQNGILFGQGAQVNVAGLIASTLNITPEAANRGLLRAAAEGKPAFSAFLDADGKPTGGAVRIARGASLRAAKGGNVLVFAPVVSNDGSIETPDGQTILAAGNKAYLMASNDINLRGLLVEVDVDQVSDEALAAFLKSRETALPAGTVRNGGRIEAARGNVTLAGLAVNQQGRVSATTAVNANGTIRLQARDRVRFINQSTSVDGTAVGIDPAIPARGGRVTLGTGSQTRVTSALDDPATQLPVNAQAPGTVTLTGRQIDVQGGATVQAQGGRIEASARADFSSNRADDSRIHVAPGATLDVAGASAALPASAHSLTLRLTATQLADAPVLRQGALRGQEVRVDLFRAGTRSDGSRWVGTPIGDVDSAAQTLPATVAQRTSAGGTVALSANGATVLAPGAVVNLRGGILHYAAGTLTTSWLYTPQGTLVDIAEADPAREYAGIFGEYSLSDRRWGVTRRWTLGLARPVPAYDLTQDNGSLLLSAPQVYLGASVLAETRRGASQRGVPGGAPHETLPKGARLVLGRPASDAAAIPDYLTPDVLLAVTPPALTALRDLDGGAFDPLTEALPAALNRTALAPGLFGAGHVQRLTVYSNGRISLPATARLALPEAAALNFNAGAIELAGQLRAPGASLSVTAQETRGTPLAAVALDLAPTARLDLRGQWVNDRQALLRDESLAPTLIEGGNLSLQSRGGALRLAAGSVIDVSGGAWLSSAGLSAGRGGNLSLAASPVLDVLTPAPVTLLAELRGEALRKSGALTLALPAVCVAASDCARGEAGLTWLSPALFDGGFGQYSVTANLGDLRVLSGTVVRPRVHSLVLGEDSSLVPGADSIAGLSRVALLPDGVRPSADLTLRVRAAPLGNGYDDANFNVAGRLLVERDASLAVERGGRLGLDANTALVIDGELSAPAGTLDITLSNSLGLASGSSAAGLLARQQIWLGPHSRLLATGSLAPEIGVGGFVGSTALAGGTLRLTAERGYVLQQAGSLLDVSGIGAGTALPAIAGSGAEGLAPYDSAGGALLIAAAEGLALGGGLRGAPGGAASAGGRLSLTLDPGLRNEPADVFAGSFTYLPQALRLSGATVAAAGTGSDPAAPAPAAVRGRGEIRVGQIEAGGFDSLALKVRNQSRNDAEGKPIVGEIRLAEAPTLRLARSIEFSAATLASDGTRARLQAPHVVLGNRANTAAFAQAVAAPTMGAGQLQVAAELIDLVGHSATTGLGAIALGANGDLRLTGVQDLGSSDPALRRRLRGAFSSSAVLDLTAAQIYPTTLSEFALAIEGNAQGRIAFHAAGDAPPPVPLSAAGQLSVHAPDIRQYGVLRAPVGRLDLDAGQRLVLAPGSLTSVSARGAVIPFGSTQGGFDWTYPLAGGETLVFDGTLNRLDAPRVRLTAGATLRLAPGATIDLRGGGDLLAYEFAPGPNGTRDLLSPAVAPDAFAILPGGGAYPPVDALYDSGSLVPGDDSVVLAASPGLPAGRYARLPARYALLPGALLVTPQAGYLNQPAFQAVSAPDGSTIVRGHREVTGSGARLGTDEAFRVLPGAAVQDFAAYTLSLAGEFFPRQARLRDRGVPPVPADGGLLQILASGAGVSLGAQVLGAPAGGGRGAAVDLASSLPIEIVTAVSGPRPGTLQLAAPALNALEVGSLLIGGLREATSSGYAIDTRTPAITVGATLTGAELLLSAQDDLSVSAGARVQGSGNAAAPQFRLSGDGVFLRAAGGVAADILRDGESANPTRGRFSLAAEATLGATGALQIDASAGLALDGQLALTGASLGLGAPRITLGGAGGSALGLSLGDEQLAALSVRELRLDSRAGIDLLGRLPTRFERLVLTGPGLGGYGDPDSRIELSAVEIELANPGGYRWPAPSDRAPGSGALALKANTLRLGDSANLLQLSGFSAVGATLSQSVVASGSGRLAVAGGFEIRSPLLTADAGADWQIASDAPLRLLGETPRAGAPVPTGLGARLDFSAPQLYTSTRIVLPSGQLGLTATGTAASDSLQIARGAVLDVAGRRQDFAGSAAVAPAGSLRLRAAAGDLQIDAGALLDVSAPAGARAGELSLLAPAGQILSAGELRAAAGAEPGMSAAVEIDVGRLPAFGLLNDFLEAGGAARERRIRARSGNVQIEEDDRVRAQRFSLVVEGGDLGVAGTLDARAALGGAITLAASGAIGLASTARLGAAASAAGAAGGKLALRSAGAATGTTTTGAVRVAAGAVIDLSGGPGGAGGELAIRLPRASVLTASAASLAARRLVLDGTLLGADSTVIEGMRAYNLSTITAAQVAAQSGNALYDDALTFMTQATAVKTALGRGADPGLHLRPGIEIRAAQDLSLGAGWNLNDWRFDGEPGVLSLRAGGNLRLNANLSDGFTSAQTNTSGNLQTTGDSWSYRLVAGADLQSADPLALRALDGLAAGSGNLLLGAGQPSNTASLPVLRVVRTGTGTIDLAAARDLSFGNAASVVYTAGRAAADGVSLNAAGQLGGRPYPVDGGDISLTAGGNILGAASDQLPSAWLFRTGRPADANGPSSAVGWTVAFEHFQQGVGALGGGELRVVAGGQISNLSAVVPTVGVQTGGTSLESSQLAVRGGGNIEVRAGGDILSGLFYLGRGQGLLRAGGKLAAGRTMAADDATPVYPVLALGDGQWSVEAAGDLTLETALNPTLVTQSLAQRAPGLPKLSYFSTYAPDSGVTLSSLFGALSLNNNASALASATLSLPITTTGDLRSLATLPPSLALRAFGGSINIRDDLALAPSPRGQLSLLAAGDVHFAEGAELVVADSDPLDLGTPLAPVSRYANPAAGHAAVPVHAEGLVERQEVIAANGSLVMGRDARLVTPSPTRLAAGLDLVEPNLAFQHLDPTDYSLLEAGRDLRYGLRRDAAGNLLQTLAGIALAGPGRLQINTGRDLDLGTSRGIETVGNQTNPALPALGASLALGVGLGAPPPDFAAFITRYLRADSPRLRDYVAALQGEPPAAGAAAFANFLALPPAVQEPLLQAMLFDELRKAGRSAAATRDSAAYARGFAALDRFYPAAGYAGDLSLFFSKIYTLAGGDITLLVPGGSINTGLASVAAGSGVNKLPSELGVVAQGTGDVLAVARDDILVNQSRVFAADGGSLLLWSSTGDIDAGRGAKTAISAPPPTITTDANGNVSVRFPPALTGSGIQNFVTTPGRRPGDVELYAPRGFVNASDAGVGSAGRVFTSLNVINTANISAVGGVVGTPVVPAAALGGALSGVSGAASAATQTALGAGDDARSRASADSVLPVTVSLNLISVDVLGFGD